MGGSKHGAIKGEEDEEYRELWRRARKPGMPKASVDSDDEAHPDNAKRSVGNHLALSTLWISLPFLLIGVLWLRSRPSLPPADGSYHAFRVTRTDGLFVRDCPRNDCKILAELWKDDFVLATVKGEDWLQTGVGWARANTMVWARDGYADASLLAPVSNRECVNSWEVLTDVVLRSGPALVFDQLETRALRGERVVAHGVEDGWMRLDDGWLPVSDVRFACRPTGVVVPRTAGLDADVDGAPPGMVATPYGYLGSGANATLHAVWQRRGMQAMPALGRPSTWWRSLLAPVQAGQRFIERERTEDGWVRHSHGWSRAGEVQGPRAVLVGHVCEGEIWVARAPNLPVRREPFPTAEIVGRLALDDAVQARSRVGDWLLHTRGGWSLVGAAEPLQPLLPRACRPL